MAEAAANDATTTADIASAKILTDAVAAEITDAVVIGINKRGGLYFAGAPADGAKVNMLLDLAKKRLIELIDGKPEVGRPLKRADPPKIVFPNQH